MNAHIDKIKKNSTPVVLFGAGDLGVLAYHALKKREIKVNFVCDSNTKKQGKLFYENKVISPNELSLMNRDMAIFICNSQYIGTVSSFLQKMKFQSVYDLVDLLKGTDYSDLNLNQNIFSKLSIERQIALHETNYSKIKNTIDKKFDVSNVDIVITERCSLKCKSCANLMQYYHRPENSDRDLLFKSIDKLMKCIDSLYEFRILGGDPLKKDKVSLQITNYGKLNYKHDETIKLCEANNISYVTERVKKWQDVGTINYEEKSISELEDLFKNCCANNLLTFLHGKLFRCPTAAHGTNLKAIPDKPKDIVDLADDKMSIEETREKLKDFYYNKKFITACSYCKGRDYGFGEIDAAIQTKKPLTISKAN